MLDLLGLGEALVELDAGRGVFGHVTQHVLLCVGAAHFCLDYHLRLFQIALDCLARFTSSRRSDSPQRNKIRTQLLICRDFLPFVSCACWFGEHTMLVWGGAPASRARTLSYYSDD